MSINELQGRVAAALAARPDSVQILETMITLERSQKHLPEAIALAQRLVEAQPKNDRYLFVLGALQGEAGDRAAAVATVRRAIEANPENAAALNYVGYSLAEQGENLDEAERLIRRALVLQPNDGFFLDSLGWVYFQRGDYTRAIDELQRAAESTGDDPTINEHLADAYRKLGREPEALRVYREALAKTEDPAQRARLEEKIRTGERATSPDGRSL